MPRSLEQILAQADQLAYAFEAYEPDAADEGKASPLVALRLAALRRTDAEVALLDAVSDAREGDVTWAVIGAQLGTTGEAARQRFGALVARSAPERGAGATTARRTGVLPGGTFEVYEDRTGKFRFRLKSGGGEIVAVGEAYETRAGALKGIEAVQRAADDAKIEELTGS